MESKNSRKYQKCMLDAPRKSLKLCPRGYCTAKLRFDVYPSAYANGYASQVCNGTIPDYDGITENSYDTKKTTKSNLRRWFNEHWVNVCEQGDGPGGFKSCGSGKGIDKHEKEIKMMCRRKRSLKPGVNNKPTRIVLPDHIRSRTKVLHVKQKGGNQLVNGKIKIPDEVRKEALVGLKLMKNGFNGGTQTGWDRGKQLSGKHIDLKSLADMRTWFARHGPDASNGGTSYVGYLKWIDHEKPMKPVGSAKKDANAYRGAVSWLLWGGDQAYLWLKSKQLRALLRVTFPKRKQSSTANNLELKNDGSHLEKRP